MRVLAVSDSEEAADILLDALTHPTSEAVLAASAFAVAHKVRLQVGTSGPLFARSKRLCCTRSAAAAT